MAEKAVYLYKSGGQEEVMCIAIGTPDWKARLWITDDEALELAYRLMSLAKGGATQGMERIA